jgi:hypothetical protein
MARARTATFGVTFVFGCMLQTPAAAQEPSPAPLPAPAVQQDAPPQPAAEGAPQTAALDRNVLERAGATIRIIRITVDNVFDPTNPKEDKKLYRWANKVHFRTHENVVANILLFRAGDVFQGRLLDESARALRERGFLAEASVEPADYDSATNTVAINVRVRDSWSLNADLKLGRSGGVNEYGFGLEDGNLLGYGKKLNVSFRNTVDRKQTLLGYEDSNLFDTRLHLNAVLGDASDGYRRFFAADRPFYELDGRWTVGGSVTDDRRVDKMYDLGEEVDRFRHDIQSLTMQGGWSRGLIDRHARRWLVGMTAEEDRFFGTVDNPVPLLLPSDRKLVYPWIGWQRVEDDYREMTKLNDIGRTEDISLGLNLLFSLGFARTSFGSDRDALLFKATAQSGWEPAPGQLLLLSASGGTRREDAGYKNTTAAAEMRYYWRNGDERLLSVTLNTLASRALDAETQVLLGGDNGLRGYPLRYQAGTSRTSVTVEQRYFTDFFPWRLFHVGYAAFIDAGRVGGRDPRAAPPLGTLWDVGFGLRLSSPRASGKSVVHIDLAFPLNGDSSIDHVQLVVETKGSF